MYVQCKSSACALAVLAVLCDVHASEQEGILPPVEVSASRIQQHLFDTPAADSVDFDWRNGAVPAVSISELLVGVPGVAIRERHNLAQDVQLSIRGFGSRATFGVRGSRLLIDGIPASTPDGQGQASTVSMAVAQHVEAVRGPWAQMYGNVGGGVLLVDTRRAPQASEADARVAVGSRGFRQAMLSTGASLSPQLGVQAAASAFSTDGAREHAAARRRYLDMRFDWQADAKTLLRVGVNGFSQPLAQDPLGLTQDEFRRNPRAVNPLALQFDTRKSVEQYQAGAYVEHRVGPVNKVTFSGYAGQRRLRQYLAFSGAAANSAGGVVDLSRQYYGASAAWHHNFRTSDHVPVRWSIGSEIEAMRDRRLGFVNANGTQGDLRRDEDNDATGFGVYAQAGAYVTPDVLLSAGARYSRVEMRVEDRYITAASPNDSGRVSYNRFSPVAGVLWHASESLNAFVNVGYGFETPTLAELAYRPNGSGVNFALQPARSRHCEAGIKAMYGNTALQGTLFRSMTDGEIVPLSNQGGRASFRNVDGVERYGLELSSKTSWRATDWKFAYTLLQARFTHGFTSADGRAVNAGGRLPGAARHTVHLAVSWRPDETIRVGADLHAEGRAQADDVNSESAPGYATLGLSADQTLRLGRSPASAFLRIDNLLDRRYAGSVIVNEANRRFYEPAAGRTLLVGLRVAL